MFGDNFGNPLLRENFEEIAIPQQPPFIPQTLGWVIVAGILAILLLWFIINRSRIWKANRYRTHALKKLQFLQETFQQPDQKASSLMQLASLVKETALYAYSRPEVASLTGQNWLHFLDKAYGGSDFSKGRGKLLLTFSYGSPHQLQQISDSSILETMKLVRTWIRGHHVCI